MLDVWTNEADINVKMFDRFSLVHLGVGVWVGSRGFGLIPALLAHTIFEIAENTIKRAHPDPFPWPSPDSPANSVGDTIAFMSGWALSLNDRLKADPWVGQTNPLRLLW
jgi:hypothetical protein